MIRNKSALWRSGEIQVQEAPLGEFVVFERGSTITKASSTEGEIPVLAGGQKPAYYHDSSNRTGCNVVVAGSGAYAGYVSYWETPIWVSDAFTVTAKDKRLTPKFLYHWLAANQSKIHSLKQGSGIPHVYGKDLAKLMFSLPTEEVQNEIVAILDKFTALEAELEAELEARQVQYEALSRIMFSIASLTPIMTWGKLGEVVRIRNGSDWKNLPVGDIPVYGSGGVMQHVGKAVHEGPSVLIPRKGSLGNIFFSAGPFWTVDTCFYTEIDFAKVLPRFLFHYLRFMNLASLNLAGGVPSLTQSQLNNVAFPMIDIQRQTEIAKILDGIQDLIEDKQAGLVVELDARRRQYEYYRDQLLTFKEA